MPLFVEKFVEKLQQDIHISDPLSIIFESVARSKYKIALKYVSWCCGQVARESPANLLI